MEVANSRIDVLLFRRYPDDAEKEKDFGPGYLKLYSLQGQGNNNNTKSNNEKSTSPTSSLEKVPAKGEEKQLYPIQVVFRSHGTMKIRANHILYPSCGTNTNQQQQQQQQQKEPFVLDTTFENELRYNVVGDKADMYMAGVPAVVYGQDVAKSPLDFPVSFEFHSEDDRDKFVNVLQQLLGIAQEKSTKNRSEPKIAAEEQPQDEEEEKEEGSKALKANDKTLLGSV